MGSVDFNLVGRAWRIRIFGVWDRKGLEYNGTRAPSGFTASYSLVVAIDAASA